MLKRALLATALCLVAATPALAKQKGGTLPWSRDPVKAPAEAEKLGRAQVYYFTGGRDWKHWEAVWVPHILGKAQRTQDGLVYWDDADRGRDRSQGRAYATAFSCLTLSVPDAQIPLFRK